MRKIYTTLVSLLVVLSSVTAQEVKNIIFFIGDGMGIASVSMMQLEGNYEPTIFDQAENIALQKTYSADNRKSYCYFAEFDIFIFFSASYNTVNG